MNKFGNLPNQEFHLDRCMCILHYGLFLSKVTQYIVLGNWEGRCDNRCILMCGLCIPPPPTQLKIIKALILVSHPSHFTQCPVTSGIEEKTERNQIPNTTHQFPTYAMRML